MDTRIKDLEKELQLAKDALQTVECGIDELKNNTESVSEGQYWAWNENDVVFRVNKCKTNRCKISPIDRDTKGYASKEEIINDARKLSTDEIEEALIKEAKRRGFKIGERVRTPGGFEHEIRGNTDIDYHSNSEELYFKRALVYRQGNWASVVDQTPHIEINGKQIEVKNGTVKISCGDTIEEEMYKNFYAVVNKYNLDVSRNGEQINEQLQQIWDEMPSNLCGNPIELNVSSDDNYFGDTFSGTITFE